VAQVHFCATCQSKRSLNTCLTILGNRSDCLKTNQADPVGSGPSGGPRRSSRVRPHLPLAGRAPPNPGTVEEGWALCLIGGANAGVVVRDDHPHGGRRGRWAHGLVRLGSRTLTPLSAGSASGNS
jgi:hypothetical protein